MGLSHLFLATYLLSILLQAYLQKIHDHVKVGMLMVDINRTLDDVVDAHLGQIDRIYRTGNLCPFRRKVLSKMVHGEPVSIYILGGSVTFGAELPNRMQQRWSTSFENILNNGWYSSKISVANLGVGACNVDVWITRVREFSSADLVIVDLSVNDQGFVLTELPVYYKTLIQLLDELPNHPAIFFTQAFRTAKYDQRDVEAHCPDKVRNAYSSWAFVVSSLRQLF